MLSFNRNQFIHKEYLTGRVIGEVFGASNGVVEAPIAFLEVLQAVRYTGLTGEFCFPAE